MENVFFSRYVEVAELGSLHCQAELLTPQWPLRRGNGPTSRSLVVKFLAFWFRIHTVIDV